MKRAGVRVCVCVTGEGGGQERVRRRERCLILVRREDEVVLGFEPFLGNNTAPPLASDTTPQTRYAPF